jgi:hypothetical protein
VDNTVFIEIAGPESDAAAKELVASFATIYGEMPRILAPRQPYSPPSSDQKIDPGTVLGAIAVVLAIPPTLLAALQLKDRLRKKEQFEQVTQKVAALKTISKTTTFRLRIGSVTMELERTTYSQIMDNISTEWK